MDGNFPDDLPVGAFKTVLEHGDSIPEPHSDILLCGLVLGF